MAEASSINFVRGKSGERVFISAMDRNTLMRVSLLADRLFTGHPDEQELSVSFATERDALQSVLDWMLVQADKPDEDVSFLSYGPIFEDAMRVHHVCVWLGVRRSLRGEDGRDSLVHYIRMAPLTLAEFAMIAELSGADSGLKVLATRETVRTQRQFIGSRTGLGVPEWDAIAEYCLANGIDLS
ncbi:hypothetical protein LTR53_006771 [Teratosphaeriaceae sp. CCFEE 6253]|nr:hypothetical protein LTR53_006771 [Teratosphaeriaceae sp. CCFEE 6253]